MLKGEVARGAPERAGRPRTAHQQAGPQSASPSFQPSQLPRLPCYPCSTLALAKELGEGPQAVLPNAELLRPCCAGSAAPPFQAVQQAAADAQRQLQARMDAVVAAMQRLKQLHAQAAAQLAAGQAASGAAAAALAPRVPPLFAGSQVGVAAGG